MTNPEKESDHRRSRFRAVPQLAFVSFLGVPVGFGLSQAGQELQTTQAFHASDAMTTGSADEGTGSCKAWADTICERMGNEQAYECTHARAASRLLTGAACAQAQAGLAARLDELKSGRVHCDELFGKVCSDVGPEGKGCEFALAKAPTFSSGECQDMKRHYGRVLAKVMNRQEGRQSDPPHEPRDGSAISGPN